MDFYSKCDQIRKKLRILSHLLKKFVMENFIFCTVFWLDMTSSLQMRVFILSREVEYFFSVNQLCEKQQTTNLLGNFVNKL